MRGKFFALISLLFAPLFAGADVVINEIAWMGTLSSASDEWIELHNTATTSIDISGWKLAAADGAPDILLTGSIEPGGYFLLERTDDDSVPGITADQIYVGGLGNGGETLRLFDALGEIRDEVVGGENWEQIGGSNDTKHTPQRQGDGSWITGEPTPRAANGTEDTAGGESVEEPRSVPSPAPVEKRYEQKTFTHIFGGDRTVTAGSVVEFRGLAFRASGREERSTRYVWNMGDGQQRFGKDVHFIYRTPGTYTTILKAIAGYDQVKKSVDVRVVSAEVTIEDVVIGPNGYIRLRNTGIIPLNISEWVLASGDMSFTFPSDTVIGSGYDVPFLNMVTGLEPSASTTVTLSYPYGDTAAVLDTSSL